jgi:hypothetical protein
MRTIWKFELDYSALDFQQTIDMPSGAEIIHVDIQNGKICIWVICSTIVKTETRMFYIIGTGHRIPEYVYKYIGTVQIPGILDVWHIFEK